MQGFSITDLKKVLFCFAVNDIIFVQGLVGIFLGLCQTPPLPTPLKNKIVHPLGIEVAITENSTCSILCSWTVNYDSLILFYLRDYKWSAHLWNESPSC